MMIPPLFSSSGDRLWERTMPPVSRNAQTLFRPNLSQIIVLVFCINCFLLYRPLDILHHLHFRPLRHRKPLLLHPSTGLRRRWPPPRSHIPLHAQRSPADHGAVIHLGGLLLLKLGDTRTVEYCRRRLDVRLTMQWCHLSGDTRQGLGSKLAVII